MSHDSPVVVLGQDVGVNGAVSGYDPIIPPARLGYEFIPSVARITDTVRATLAA